MAPLPASNTARFRVNYTVNGEAHDFQIRSAGSPGSVGSFIDNFLTTLSPELFLVMITTVDHAVSGSNIFLPVTTGIESNTYGSGTGATEQKAWFVDFVGRSTGGRRWRLAIFGIRAMAGDFRYLPGENATIDDTIVDLASGAAVPLAIDGLEVTVYPYANAGVNAYWQRAIRP